MTATLNPSGVSTLEDARAYLQQKAQEGGAPCPCCDQFAKVYRRKITTATAQALILMHRKAGKSWVYLPELLGRKQADEAKARYWGLIEESTVGREDGSSRAGIWRLTDLGEDFVKGNVTIPKYALIYDGQCVGLDDSERISIQDALGTKFVYGELMGGN